MTTLAKELSVNTGKEQENDDEPLLDDPEFQTALETDEAPNYSLREGGQRRRLEIAQLLLNSQ